MQHPRVATLFLTLVVLCQGKAPETKQVSLRAPTEAEAIKAKASPPVTPPKKAEKAVSAEVSLRAPTKAELAKAKSAPPASLKTQPPKSAKTPSKVSLIKTPWNEPRISPPLKDVKSDKKFFGPPFPADYPDDQRPVVDKSILNKLKGPDQPYPALQSKADFDRDYVKDENSDKGSWSAQFEYDALRRKLAKEAADAKRAEGQATKEGHDVDDAQRAADDAAKRAGDAKKDLDGAVAGEGEAGKGDDIGGPPSAEKLEELKKRVAQAEADYEKEKKEFAECEKQLQDAKTNIEELKAKQVEMEQQLASETKLWEEKKAIKLNVQKAKQEEAAAKRQAAEERLTLAKQKKADMDGLLAAKLFKSQQANLNLQKEKAKMDQFKKDFAKATLTLQKIRGYKPTEATPLKNGAFVVSMQAVLAVLSFLAMTNL